jgi:hypothetical protein
LVPIRKFLEGQAFDPEAIDVMSQALIGVCNALGSRVADDAATRCIAARVIEAARDGERDPERLKNAALKSLRN